MFKEYFFFKKNGVYSKVHYLDIICIEANGNYVNTHLVTGEKILLRNTISKIEKDLPEKKFLKVHRSYMIQFDKIDSVNFNDNYLTIKNLKIPFNRSNKETIKKLITKNAP